MAEVAFQIIITSLLGIVTALGGWALKQIIEQGRHADKRHLEQVELQAARHSEIREEITQIKQQIWGRDGRNGHTSDLRDLKRALQRIFDALADYDYRIRRVEEHAGIQTPSTPHPRIRRREESDESEDDRSA